MIIPDSYAKVAVKKVGVTKAPKKAAAKKSKKKVESEDSEEEAAFSDSEDDVSIPSLPSRAVLISTF